MGLLHYLLGNSQTTGQCMRKSSQIILCSVGYLKNPKYPQPMGKEKSVDALKSAVSLPLKQ